MKDLAKGNAVEGRNIHGNAIKIAPIHNPEPVPWYQKAPASKKAAKASTTPRSQQKTEIPEAEAIPSVSVGAISASDIALTEVLWTLPPPWQRVECPSIEI